MIREISLYSNNSRLTDIHPLEKLSLTIISLIGASYINNNYILSVNILFFIILEKKQPIYEEEVKKVEEVNPTEEIVIEEPTVETKDDFNLEKKVTVRSIASWTTGATRKTSIGDITIPAMGSVLLSREEIIAQGQNGNTLLTGIDGVGSHAEWYIEDEYTRNELSFDTDDKKQEFLTEDAIKKIFELKTKKAFEDNIVKSVVTRPEKFYLLHTIKNLGLNDYSKIAFCEEHCGYRVSEI